VNFLYYCWLVHKVGLTDCQLYAAQSWPSDNRIRK
jgi:hypothetical protein